MNYFNGLSLNGISKSLDLLLADGMKREFADTALHGAAIRGYWELCNVLIADGADYRARNSKGQTAYDLAVEFGHEAAAQTILAHMERDALEAVMLECELLGSMASTGNEKKRRRI